MDVANDASIEKCLRDIFQETGNVVDVCVNNAGYSETGGIESVTMEAARKQFDTNFFGLVKVIVSSLLLIISLFSSFTISLIL